VPITSTSLKVGHKGRYEKKCSTCSVKFVATYPSVQLCAACKCRQVFWGKYTQRLHQRNLWRSDVDKSRERARREARAWRAKLKREMVDAYGGKCACCGETQIEFLTIDHVNGNGAEERKAAAAGSGTKSLRGWAGSPFYDWLRKQGWPQNGYQILCFNCNCAKRQNGECPHKLLALVHAA